MSDAMFYTFLYIYALFSAFFWVPLLFSFNYSIQTYVYILFNNIHNFEKNFLTLLYFKLFS